MSVVKKYKEGGKTKKVYDVEEQLAKKIANLENAQDIIFEQFRELELQRLSIDKQQKKLARKHESTQRTKSVILGKGGCDRQLVCDHNEQGAQQ